MISNNIISAHLAPMPALGRASLCGMTLKKLSLYICRCWEFGVWFASDRPRPQTEVLQKNPILYADTGILSGILITVNVSYKFTFLSKNIKLNKIQ